MIREQSSRCARRGGRLAGFATRGLAAALLLLLAGAAEARAEGAAKAAPAAPTTVVNINTATFQELQALPGIGASRARAILAVRKERGGFKEVAELTQVKGIGARSLERLRPYVRISGKTRVPATAPRR